MKKRSICFALIAAVVMCSMLSTTAFAWDDTEMTAQFKYTKEAPAPESEPTYTPKYEVALPSPTSFTGGYGDVTLRMAYNALNENDQLVVKVNPSSYDEHGNFFLKSEEGNIVYAAIARYGNDPAAAEMANSGDDNFTVAVFDNSGMDAIQYGTIRVMALGRDAAAPGEYTGYLHLSIELTQKN